MTEETGIKLKTVGRWIAVVPGGVLAGVLVLFPLHWILYLSLVKGNTIEMPLEDLAPIERFLSPIVSSIAFVYAGAAIAPKKQIHAATILFILSLFIRIGLLTYVNASGLKLDTTFLGLSRMVLSTITGGLGVLLISVSMKNKSS